MPGPATHQGPIGAVTLAPRGRVVTVFSVGGEVVALAPVGRPDTHNITSAASDNQGPLLADLCTSVLYCNVLVADLSTSEVDNFTKTNIF